LWLRDFKVLTTVQNRKLWQECLGTGPFGVPLTSTCGKQTRKVYRFAVRSDSEKGILMKAIVTLSLVVVAVALGACRREEAAPEPMKLGAAPAVEQSAR
jgi:hypothetical protein